MARSSRSSHFVEFLSMSLSLQDIHHRFDASPVLRGCSLVADDGEIVVLFGPSGCGKTTLLRIAAGLEPVQRGAVLADGLDISQTVPERRPVGLVFQDFVLFPHMTVAENIGFGVRQTGKAKRARIEQELAAINLSDLAKRYPHELSGGQQQRIALARALARDPRVLLLDEPFSSIDAVHRRHLRDALRQMLKARGVAVVMVTHDPEEALAIGDRIAVMREGLIVEDAAPDALFTAPETAAGASLFPDAQRFDGVILNGQIKTPAGIFPADGVPDGAGEVVIHEHGLRAAPDENGTYQISDLRFVGPGWRAMLRAPEFDAAIRVPLSEPAQLGARMALSVENDAVFVFAV